jgi:flagellar biosynthesis protein FlhB
MAERPDRDQQTEAPTQKRKTDAVREGDILQSRELATALVLLAGAAWLALAGPWFMAQCLLLVRDGLSLSAHEARHFDPLAAVLKLASFVLLPLASLFGIAILASVAAPAMLGAFGFRAGAMAFKGSRINPVAGLGRMFGTHGLVELAKALGKAAVLGILGWWVVMDELAMSVGLAGQDLQAAAGNIGRSVVMSILILTLGLALIALIDVPVQIIRRNARLRMTKQQVKEEMRQSEGAPELKAAVRQRRQEVLMGSARKAVSEATVVLTNPTHFAVALRYRPGIDAAPVVVARGRGETALAIRNLAKVKSVPTLEYPQLTRAIYFTTRAGHIVSEDLFMAVATVLAFVLNIERALTEGITLPNVTVPEAKHFDEHGRRPPA